ncbi:MAG: ATP-binding protein [Opitutae bacterium]|nr:ATP-binding protein [Opitutae bacterium]
MTKIPTISEIENAFQPAREADEPARFAGRTQAVLDCYYALLTAGSNIGIVGNRGIGKSSLARQLIRMATGDNTLVQKLHIPASERIDFVSMYFACGDSVANTEELLQRILTRSDCLRDWIYDIPKAKAEIEVYKPKIGVSVFGLEAEKRSEIRSDKAITDHSIDVVFSNVVQAIAQQKLAKHGILIVIDEFDRIKQPAGFASFLKALATNVPEVKFCIVGVAQDIKELMKEHESTDRLFAGSIVRLPAMTDAELSEIVRNAEKSIDEFIVFDHDATSRLVALAQGHPYMVHLVGKFALRSAFQRNVSKIVAADVDATLKGIAERGADPVLEGRYQKAVATSAQRESVLRALASKISRDGEVWTTEAYKVALDDDVDNSSQYVGQLVTEEYGAEIEKIRERFYRFKDSLFAAYVNARPRQFTLARPIV